MSEKLAIAGGTPVRSGEYGPQHIFGEDDVEAVAEVIRSGFLGKGPKVREFEAAWAARHGVKHAVTATSGTAAMHVAAGALDLDPGDEIITTPITAGGSIIGLLFQNCVPIFADVDETYNIDPTDVEAKITSRTRAIWVTHLYGNPCDMDALRAIADKHDLYLVEDCCHAPLAEYKGQIVGTLGDIGGFSFGGKHLSGGVGGAVVTDNESLWERAVIFSDVALPRAKGPWEDRPYQHYFLAPNYRMSDLTAAVLLSQLSKLEDYVENKVRAAKNINAGIADVEGIVPQPVRPDDRSTYWVWGATLSEGAFTCSAQEFVDALVAEGLSDFLGPRGVNGRAALMNNNPFLSEPHLYGRSHTPLDIGRNRPYDYKKVSLPVAEDIARRRIFFQVRPTYTEDDVGDIIYAIRKVAIHYQT
ncbi:MAG: DegT/DnrJ/EryC1/StrS family aminotransferase [SAR202 cluster bacterium]|jgi:dTDP-4-amino-4,6-dideoxygalactose transaminase|nr:DegT/DnrJ/EryC1/StrS family aminotransferase [SAR202 cluster bacterium]